MQVFCEGVKHTPRHIPVKHHIFNRFSKHVNLKGWLCCREWNIYSDKEKEWERESSRDSCQGTDELIVETGISTLPCQCAPCHDTELKNKRGEEMGAHRGRLLLKENTVSNLSQTAACRWKTSAMFLTLKTLACLDCSFIFALKKNAHKHTPLSPRLQSTAVQYNKTHRRVQ